MARGKLRIRQRGSRQQWAHARTFKEFGSDEIAALDSDSPLRGSDVVASTRCGLCGMVTEQKLRDGRTLVLAPHSLCISCDQVRCHECWTADDDPCADADEHEFFEVHYAREGAPAITDFGKWGTR